MATLTETGVIVNVRLLRGANGENRCFVESVSTDSTGKTLRTIAEVDVTSFLNSTQQQAGLTLLNAAEAWAKGQFQIP